MTSAVQQANPGADVIGARHALAMNTAAAKGLAEVLKTNLGPRGTMKMLVSGAGTVKTTKDGKVLLDEMQIQHPTASIIARTATAQDDITGDGTTSNVLLTGELLKQAERYLAEGLHPRVLVEGFEKARDRVLELLDKFKVEQKGDYPKNVLMDVCRTSLRTKLPEEVADHLTEIVTRAVLTIRRGNESPDLHMVEIMVMKHKTALDSSFIDGLVLDHGARHPDMARRNENAYLLVCNVSLEYEKTEVNSGIFYKSAEERAKMAVAERAFTDARCQKIIDLKKKVIGDRKDATFIVINQKGIDPISLDMLQKHNIVGIRRAKRRNMERLTRACGGIAVNSLDDMTEECLGFAKAVYEHQLGEEVFTFVEGCKNPTSCTVLLKGPNDHTINQLKDAVHDGLRAVFNAIEDKCLIPGAGAFELAAYNDLQSYKAEVAGRAKLGVDAFANALLVIPKTLVMNAGHDAQSSILDVLDELRKSQKDGSKIPVGVDLETGKAMDPRAKGVWDNYRVKKQFLHLGSLIAIKLLLVDEVMRAGRKMGKG